MLLLTVMLIGALAFVQVYSVQAILPLLLHDLQATVVQGGYMVGATMIEGIGLDEAAGADLHVADHRQPLGLRIERAQAVGQLFRQHEDDATREIQLYPSQQGGYLYLKIKRP